MQYLVVIEKTATGFSVYSPALTGCVSTGSTREEIDKNIREAIEFHFEGLRQEGYELPPPSTYSTYIDIPA